VEGGTVEGGDQVPNAASVQACIDRIRQSLRPSDTVARLDHSTLAVVAEDLHDEQDAAGVAYRLLSTVVEPVPGEAGEVGLRMVIGLVMADGSTPPNALISATAEAAADARSPGGFVLMDLRDIED
ncbi:MAG: diguanylate cyclase domain-containing protein, partial [Microthrixaceae bacterium]